MKLRLCLSHLRAPSCKLRSSSAFTEKSQVKTLSVLFRVVCPRLKNLIRARDESFKSNRVATFEGLRNIPSNREKNRCARSNTKRSLPSGILRFFHWIVTSAKSLMIHEKSDFVCPCNLCRFFWRCRTNLAHQDGWRTFKTDSGWWKRCHLEAESRRGSFFDRASFNSLTQVASIRTRLLTRPANSTVD